MDGSPQRITEFRNVADYLTFRHVNAHVNAPDIIQNAPPAPSDPPPPPKSGSRRRKKCQGDTMWDPPLKIGGFRHAEDLKALAGYALTHGVVGCAHGEKRDRLQAMSKDYVARGLEGTSETVLNNRLKDLMKWHLDPDHAHPDIVRVMNASEKVKDTIGATLDVLCELDETATGQTDTQRKLNMKKAKADREGGIGIRTHAMMKSAQGIKNWQPPPSPPSVGPVPLPSSDNHPPAAPPLSAPNTTREDRTEGPPANASNDVVRIIEPDDALRAELLEDDHPSLRTPARHGTTVRIDTPHTVISITSSPARTPRVRVKNEHSLSPPLSPSPPLKRKAPSSQPSTSKKPKLEPSDTSSSSKRMTKQGEKEKVLKWLERQEERQQVFYEQQTEFQKKQEEFQLKLMERFDRGKALAREQMEKEEDFRASFLSILKTMAD